MGVQEKKLQTTAITEAVEATIEAIRRPLLNIEDALAPLREVDQKIYMRIHERIATVEMLLKKDIPEDIKELQLKCWHHFKDQKGENV